MAIFISGDRFPWKKTKLTVKKVRPKGQNKTHLFILKKNPDPEKERWKNATSNLSDLIYDLLTIIFQKQLQH